MSGDGLNATCLWEIIPAFIDRSSRSCRVITCGSVNMAGLLGMAVLACVVFIHTPTMIGTEIPTMKIIANGGL